MRRTLISILLVLANGLRIHDAFSLHLQPLKCIVASSANRTPREISMTVSPTQRTKEEQKSIPPNLLLSKSPEYSYVTSIVIGEVLLYGAAIVMGTLLGIDIFQSEKMTADLHVWSSSLQLAGFGIIGGIIFDRLPIRTLEQVSNNIVKPTTILFLKIVCKFNKYHSN